MLSDAESRFTTCCTCSTTSPTISALSRDEDLPGYWTVPFVRAGVEHPAGCAARPTHSLRQRRAFRLDHPVSIVFRGCLPTAHPLARRRINDAVAGTAAKLATDPAGLGPGRTGFAPAGRLLRISRSHRSFLPDQHGLVATLNCYERKAA